MANCLHCGKEIRHDSAFCSNCGSPVQLQANSGNAEKSVTFEVVTREKLKMIRVDLVNDAFRYEAGALHYMNGNLDLESDVPGLGKIFRSMLTKEKIIKPVSRGTGTVILEPSFGEFTILDLVNDEWILDRGAYYASDLGIELGAYTNNAISGLFSGEKWFQTIVAGTGKVIIQSAGPLEEVILKGNKLIVDGSFAVARTSGVELQVKKATKGIFSSMISGEGFVNTFSGNGKVLIAPVSNYLSTLIGEIRGINYRVQQILSKQ